MSELDRRTRTEARCTLVLRLAAFFCFAGWTWVHYYWEGPYGVLFWDEHVYGLAERLGISWESFVGSGANDGVIQTVIRQMFWLYLGCAILTLTVRRGAWVQMAFLLFGSGLLSLVAYTKYLSAERQLPMLLEFGGQVLAPAVLVLALALGARHRLTVILAVLAVVMTFAGHGAYAIGWWPTPGNFYGMITKILPVDHETVVGILFTAGVLDFAVCVALCIPVLRRPAALYATCWGLLTALARPWAGMDTTLHYWGADQFVHEAVLRAPHFLLPLYLFLLWRRPPQEARSSQTDEGLGDPPGAPASRATA
ncbi:MAG: hypothetical protein MK108_02790 [Mariniblastus sp.]|nr:hypothetical protein [Mariniblastus sp.]